MKPCLSACLISAPGMSSASSGVLDSTSRLPPWRAHRSMNEETPINAWWWTLAGLRWGWNSQAGTIQKFSLALKTDITVFPVLTVSDSTMCPGFPSNVQDLNLGDLVSIGKVGARHAGLRSSSQQHPSALQRLFLVEGHRVCQGGATGTVDRRWVGTSAEQHLEWAGGDEEWVHACMMDVGVWPCKREPCTERKDKGQSNIVKEGKQYVFMVIIMALSQIRSSQSDPIHSVRYDPYYTLHLFTRSTLLVFPVENRHGTVEQDKTLMCDTPTYP